MSLEYQVEQLVAVLSRGVQNSAVAEIIRQRDQAIKDAKEAIHWRDYWNTRYEDSWKDRQRVERKNAALRGAITRMKRKSSGPVQEETKS